MFLVYCNDGKRNYADKHYVHPHSRKEWAFHFILKGSCIRLTRVDGVTIKEPLEGPMLAVSGPDCIHGWSAESKDVCSVLIFHFDEADFNLRHVIGRSGYRLLHFPVKDIPHLQALFDRCIRAKKSHDPSSLTIYHIVSLELTLFFLSHISRNELAGGADFSENKVIEALAWYEANLKLGPNIREVADAIHLSSTHLRRLFHKVRGVAPQVAFTHAQFERAKELMLDRSIPLERIAESSGFGSASAFSRAFKMEFGMSPKVYRSVLLKEHSSGSSFLAGAGERAKT